MTEKLLQESGGAAARAELGLGGDQSSSSAGQRERMLSATSKMQQTGDRITQGRQQLLETEVCHLLLCFCSAAHLPPASTAQAWHQVHAGKARW